MKDLEGLAARWFAATAEYVLTYPPTDRVIGNLLTAGDAVASGANCAADALLALRAERDAARREAERSRDRAHWRACEQYGHDPEKSSKRLFPWEPKGEEGHDG
jgi:hypothetical protein